MPYKVLEVRGTVRCLGEEAAGGWLQNLAVIFPRMTRVFVRPTWVGMIGFETRFPAPIERAMEAAAAGR